MEIHSKHHNAYNNLNADLLEQIWKEKQSKILLNLDMKNTAVTTVVVLQP
jgi:hypothetical protein